MRACEKDPITNPINAFLEWFESTSESLQREIAFNSFSRSPDIELQFDFDDSSLINAFRNWLMAGKAHGKILIVREVVDSLDLGYNGNVYLALRTDYLTTEVLNRWVLQDTEQKMNDRLEGKRASNK